MLTNLQPFGTLSFVVVRLRPLIVVTGTIRVSGGESTTQKTDVDPADATKSVVLRRKVTAPERKAALSLITTFLKKLNRCVALDTPFGRLVEPDVMTTTLKGVLAEIDGKVRAFNSAVMGCALVNAVVWEPLSGNRKARVEAWLEANADDKKLAAFSSSHAA